MKRNKILSLFLALIILFSSVPVGAIDLDKINESLIVETLEEATSKEAIIEEKNNEETENPLEEDEKSLEKNEDEKKIGDSEEVISDKESETRKSDLVNNDESSKKLSVDAISENNEDIANKSDNTSTENILPGKETEKSNESLEIDEYILSKNVEESKKLELDDLEERIKLLSRQLAEENNSNNVKETIDKEVSDTARFMYKTVTEPEVGSVAGEWTVLSLARSGEPVPENYFEDYYKRVEDYVKAKKGELHRVKYTEYSRVIVALTSIGKDPRNVAGYDLVKPLSNYDKVKRQGINGPIWALIALDTRDFELSDINDPKAQNSRDVMIKDILVNEAKVGGWNLFREVDGNTDPDITAMALYALAPYKNRQEVSDAIDRGIQALSRIQLPTGGYTTMGDENSESSAQVIIALTTLGIDPHTDERFIKNGNSVVDAILTYKAPDGGYKHIHSETTANAMGTDQAMEALIALKRFYEGKNALFDMSDEKLEDPEVKPNPENPEVNPNPAEQDLSKNKKDLEDIVDLAEKIKKADYVSDDGKDIYTNETWVTKDTQNHLEQAITNSKKILDKKDATNKEITDTLENLKKAIKDYKPKSGLKIKLKDETLTIGVANPAGGVITPSGIVKYSKDSPVTLRFIPNFDYELDYVTVDNRFFQYSDKLTLPHKDIQEGSVISAVFRKKAINRVDAPKKNTVEIDTTKRNTVKNNNDQIKLVDNTKYIVVGSNYSDIKNHWAETSINYVTAKGYFKGVGENKFDPDGILTRAMMVTILGRLDGVSEANTITTFYDVDSNSYYAAHVAWALKNGITDGTGKGTFSPDKPITREEMAKFFDSFLKYKNIKFADVNNSYISDKSNISSWALDSVENMYKAGVLKGTPDGSFLPKDFSTRAQLATVIYNIDTQALISSNTNSQPTTIKLKDKASNILNSNTTNNDRNTLDSRKQEEDLRKKLEDETNRKKLEEERRREEERKIKERAIIESSKGPKDKYMTDPTPAGRPKPVEPGTEEISSEVKTATLSIRCDTILQNMDRLEPSKVPFVPSNGVILDTVEVKFHPGESVYDVIKRETADRGIQMESTFTPMYNSAYIEGINNLYEFDCGELSGWMYKVNGWFPNYGCSRYLVKEGDIIEWVYTCDLGRDVGDNSMVK